MHSQLFPDGPARDALRQAAADLDAAEASGQPYAMSQALAQLGRSYRGIGALDAAVAACEQALRWSHLVGAADLTVGLLCDLCDIATATAEGLDDGDTHGGPGHAARESAREHAFEAARCAAGLGDARREVDALLRISDALERCGDRDDAIALQTRAMRLIAGESPADALMLAATDC